MKNIINSISDFEKPKKKEKVQVRLVFCIFKNVILLLLILILTIYGCGKEYNTSSLDVKNKRNEHKTFFITPMIEGIGACEYVRENLNLSSLVKLNPSKLISTFHLIFKCMRHHFSSSILLNNILNEIEPNSPRGEIQLGYTFSIPILGLFEKNGNRWVIDEEKIEDIFKLIKEVNRPVILYLMLNHFDTANQLSKELINNKLNFMKLQDGTIPFDIYFGNDVLPFTLSIDENIPVNHYRFKGFRTIVKKIVSFDSKNPNLIKGITIGGEIHHLFPNFKRGMDLYQDCKFTDYSPVSIKEFREWLKDRFVTLEKLNKVAETQFQEWGKIIPPDKDIRKQQLKGFWEHIDTYSIGILPIFGWISHGGNVRSIDIYIDGQRIGSAITGLNRLDVYESIVTLENPNVGFRYDLTFSTIEKGIHTIHVVVELTDNQRLLLAERKVVVMDAFQSQPTDYLLKNGNTIPDAMSDQEKNFYQIQYWLDHPKNYQDLFFNPYAKIWQEFREYQVERFLLTLWKIAVESGFDPDRIFTHQLIPQLNGSWNDFLFATGKSINDNSPYLPGITLYGGVTFSKHIDKYTYGRSYGVPEFHPLMHKASTIHKKALLFHKDRGAIFVSPYYISLLPKHTVSKQHARMMIEESNNQRGSAYLLHAIKELSIQ